MAKVFWIVPNGRTDRVLEISSRSDHPMGKALSAMNLTLPVPWGTASVESLYQGSKVFENGGPYTDLYRKSGFEAKRDKRLRNSGKLIGFRLFGNDFGLQPKSAFYDMLWITAFIRSPYTVGQLKAYHGFSDAFHREGMVACQAGSAALLAQREPAFAKCEKALDVWEALIKEEEMKKIKWPS